jgi:hypothetical protein
MRRSAIIAAVVLALSPFGFVFLCSMLDASETARLPALVIAKEHGAAAAPFHLGEQRAAR